MQWASRDDVESAIQSWNDGQVQCRSYGHNWRAHDVRHRPGIYTVVQRCPRCHNTRTQEMNERGYTQGPWQTQYAPGYLLQNVGRVGFDGRAALRIATLRSMVITEEEVE